MVHHMLGVMIHHMLGVMDPGTQVPRYPAYIYIYVGRYGPGYLGTQHIYMLDIRKPGYPGLLVEVIPDHFRLVLAPRIPAPVGADLDI